MRALSRSSAVGLCKAAGLCHGECDGAIALAPARPSRAVDHRPRRRRRRARERRDVPAGYSCGRRSRLGGPGRGRSCPRRRRSGGAQSRERRAVQRRPWLGPHRGGHRTVAAARSTGGALGKRPGRVGDSALIGCGTYADSSLGGVSCTGDGEAIIRVVLARRALDYLKEADDPDYAAKVSVDLLVEEGRGEGGLIVVDWRGRIGYAQSTALMPVGWMTPSLGEPALPF